MYEDGLTESQCEDSTDKYLRFKEEYVKHLDWCIQNNSSNRSKEQWDKARAKDFYERNLDKFFN